jgi:hypothetical protein
MGINQSDVAMRDLLSQIDNLDAKKKRLRIAQSCQYGREMAEYYEVFDTMKRDILKQSLIVARIKEQQCEAHLQIMREYRRAEEQLQSTQPPPVNQHTEWATVATQAIRTIGELGKELLTSRATKQIEKQRAATEQRADEARKTADEKPARRAAAEQTTTAVAAMQSVAVPAVAAPATPEHAAVAVSTLSAPAAPVGAVGALEALCAKVDRFFGGAGGQPSTSMPVAAQTESAIDPQTATSTATVSITPTITPNVTASITPTITPNLEQSKRRADGCAEGSSTFHDRRQTIREGDLCDGNASHAAMAPTAAKTEAIVAPSVAPSVTPSVAPSVSQNEREADGSDEGSLSAQASESPEGTASPTVKQTAEPPTETAQTGASKGSSLTLSQNPYVKSWRSIKSFVRRMTDMDLMIFTSSIPMFRSFLAMLRALTPYYQGPTMSLDELTEMATALS